MSRIPNRPLAPHVQAMMSSGAQAKIFPASAVTKAATHVQTAIQAAQGRPSNRIAAPPIQRKASGTSLPRAPGPGIPGLRGVVQRKETDPDKIEEGDWAAVGSNGHLCFTALTGGCLAVVASFSSGGGVGVHLALNIDNAGQWGPFYGAVGKNQVRAVYLYGDMVGQAQGWYVKFKLDDMFLPEGPDIATSPRSAAELTAGFGSTTQAKNHGWASDTGSIEEWFKAALRTGQYTLTRTQAAVVHQCN